MDDFGTGSFSLATLHALDEAVQDSGSDLDLTASLGALGQTYRAPTDTSNEHLFAWQSGAPVPVEPATQNAPDDQSLASMASSAHSLAHKKTTRKAARYVGRGRRRRRRRPHHTAHHSAFLFQRDRPQRHQGPARRAAHGVGGGRPVGRRDVAGT